MKRSYRHMQEYEKEIIELREKGFSRKEICEKFGFTIKQYENFITRYNTKQRKLAAGIIPKKKGRQPKDCVAVGDTVAELKHILARKDAQIKRLEMENELMRDFLSETEGM